MSNLSLILLPPDETNTLKLNPDSDGLIYLIHILVCINYRKSIKIFINELCSNTTNTNLYTTSIHTYVYTLQKRKTCFILQSNRFILLKGKF